MKGSPMTAERSHEAAFFETDDFRQSYPYSRPISQLNVSANDQLKELHFIASQASEMYRQTTCIRSEIASSKAEILTHVQNLHFQALTDKSLMQTTLATTKAQIFKWHAAFNSTFTVCQMEARKAIKLDDLCKRLQVQLNLEQVNKDNLDKLVLTEQLAKDSIQNELVEHKEKAACTFATLNNLITASASKFDIPSGLIDQLRHFLATFEVSPIQVNIHSFVDILSEVTESQVKKVYRELRCTFEEGRQVLLEDAEHKSTLVANLTAKCFHQEASMSAMAQKLDALNQEKNELESQNRDQKEKIEALQSKLISLGQNSQDVQAQLHLKNEKIDGFMKNLKDTFQDSAIYAAVEDHFTQTCEEVDLAKSWKMYCTKLANSMQLQCQDHFNTQALLTENEIEHLKMSLISCNDNVKRWEAAYEQQAIELKESLSKVEILERSLVQASEAASEFKSQVDELQQTLSDKISASDAASANLTQVFESINCLIHALTNGLDLDKSTSASLDHAILELAHAEQDKEREILMQQISNSFSKILETEKSRALSGLQTEYGTFQQQKNQLDCALAELERLHKELQLKSTTLQCLETAKSHLCQELELCQAQLTSLESEQLECRRTNTILERKFKKLESSFQELELTHSKTLATLEEIQSNYQVMIGKYNEAKRDLEMHRDSMDKHMYEEKLVALQVRLG
ncbi:hypothetical protein BC830DRAFT_379178 [Chytriomyces sp. MP71]|nr:hypothetical protein BC830DRAFT_379178 [Chytriomyces sp. MP71]